MTSYSRLISILFRQIKDIVKKASSNLSEADVTFFVYEAGKVANASYVVSIMNRLSTGDMTTVTSPYAVRFTLSPTKVPCHTHQWLKNYVFLKEPRFSQGQEELFSNN